MTVMNKEFLKRFQEILNSETPVEMSMRLKEIPEWDSLSAMAFITLAERRFNKRLRLSDLKNKKTVEELYGLLV